MPLSTATLLLSISLSTATSPIELEVAPLKKMTYYLPASLSSDWGVCLRVSPEKSGESSLEIGKVALRKTFADSPSETVEKRCVIFSGAHHVWPKPPKNISVSMVAPRSQAQGPNPGWKWVATEPQRLEIKLSAKK